MRWPSLKAVPRHVTLVEKGLTRAIHWCRLRDFRFTYKGETSLKITDLNRSSWEDLNRKSGVTRRTLETIWLKYDRTPRNTEQQEGHPVCQQRVRSRLSRCSAVAGIAVGYRTRADRPDVANS